jgi:hypothetical protein
MQASAQGGDGFSADARANSDLADEGADAMAPARRSRKRALLAPQLLPDRRSERSGLKPPDRDRRSLLKPEGARKRREKCEKYRLQTHIRVGRRNNRPVRGRPMAAVRRPFGGYSERG